MGPDLPPVSFAPFQEAAIQAYVKAMDEAARAIAQMEPTWARVAAEMAAAMGYLRDPDHDRQKALHVAYDRRRRARRRRRNR